MTQGNAATHPGWCDRALCEGTEHAWHYSRPMVLGEPGGVGTTVRNVQSAPKDDDSGSGVPMVEITFVMPRFDETDTDENEYTIVLTGERALAFGHQITSAARAVVRG